MWVPLLLAPRHGSTSVDQPSPAEEDRIRAVLLEPLERFICGGAEVEKMLSGLQAEDCPPAVCGKVFQPGETCYNCRDCGQDHTCVLCVECFTASEHRHHRYRIISSDGGGYCDCGDQEAFNPHPACSRHAQPAGQGGRDSASVLHTFPPDLRHRSTHTLYHVAKYCIQVVADPKGQVDLVSGQKEKELFPDLQYPLKYSNFCCQLINDEHHSYQEVIRVLENVLPKPTKQLAQDLTTYVDKVGQAVIVVGSYQECCAASQKIESLTRIRHSTVLKTRVVSSAVVAHQQFATRLLAWLPSLFKVSSGFRALFAEVALSSQADTALQLKRRAAVGQWKTTGPHSIAEAVLLNDISSWKQVRALWLTLLIDGLMKDHESKKALGLLFTRNYAAMARDYFADDQEQESSAMQLSVQIFTVPSLAALLLEECDALSALLSPFLSLLDLEDCSQEPVVLELAAWQTEERSEFQRGLQSLHDLTYLLAVPPTQWTPGLRTAFQAGAGRLLQLLACMQGMDSMRRQVGQHVEMEDDAWKLTFELQRNLSEIVQLLERWAVSDRAVLVHTIQETLRLITLKQPPSEIREMSKHLAFLGPPANYQVVEYDVSKELVSLHCPLHRLLSRLLLAAPNHGLTPGQLQHRLTNSLALPQLVEPVLRTVVTVAQVGVGMWRRNGTTADSQAFLYNSRRFCAGLKESDLLLLQLAASLPDTDQDTFLVTLLARFKLARWATGDLDTETLVRSEEFVEHCNGLAEEWLLLVVAMVGERSEVGLGQGVTTHTQLRKEVLQLLCVEPLAHSEVVKLLPGGGREENGLDAVLTEVATLGRAATGSGKKVYQLRSGLEKEYNMFHYGYTTEQQTKAMERQLSGEGDNAKAGCPPPTPPRPTALAARLPALLSSPVLLAACRVTLRRAAETGPGRSRYVTERQLHLVIFLVALGLRQAEDGDPAAQDWRSRAEEAGLLELVQQTCCNTTNTPNPLVTDPVRRLAGWLVGRDGRATGESGQEGQQEAARASRAAAAAARRAKIMAQMKSAQSNFASENSAALAGLGQLSEAGVAEEAGRWGEKGAVCLGPGQAAPSRPSHRRTCILCQEETSLEAGQPAMVLAAFVQKSTVLSGAGRGQHQVSPHHLSVSRDCGPHLATCGHAMHATCYQKFFDSQVVKERDRNIHSLIGKKSTDENIVLSLQ